MVANLISSIRFSIRLLRRSPGFAAVAILSLALGIGANTALFSLVDAVVLRPLPVHKPDQLCELRRILPNDQRRLFSYPMFEAIEKYQGVFSGLSAWGSPVLVMKTDGNVFPGAVMTITENYFRILGVRPLIGNFTIPVSDESGSPASRATAVISYPFWQEHYGGEPTVLGKSIEIQGKSYTIIGVAPKSFGGLLVGISADVWIQLGPPLVTSAILENPKAQDYWVTARLRDGITVQAAQAQIGALWPSLLRSSSVSRTTPNNKRMSLEERIQVTPIATGILPVTLSKFERPLWVLMSLVGLFLLIACANLANLMLARAAGRHHEMGVRLAVGAAPWRLAQQMLMEGVTLSVMGAIAGIPLAYWLSHSLAKFVWTANVPLTLDLTLNTRSLGFTTLVAILTGILFAFASAWSVARQDPATVIASGSRTMPQKASGLVFVKFLMVTQIALSLIFLDVAALFTGSLANLHSTRRGFQIDGVTDIRLQPVPGGYKGVDTANYYHQLINTISTLPGMRSVSLSAPGPVESIEFKMPVSASSSSSVTTEAIEADIHMISPNFFRTLGMNLLQGRDFDLQDNRDAPRVAIISKGLARRLFPSSDGLGNLINAGPEADNQNLLIIGIVSDSNLYNLRDQNPSAIYLPFFQQPKPIAPAIETNAQSSSGTVIAGVRKCVEELGHDYVFRADTLNQEIERSLLRDRALAMLSDTFGGLALLLAAIGVYGLMTYSVAMRVGEIGIRMAVGATRTDILRLIISDSLFLVAIGTAAGVPVALGITRLISGMLFGLNPQSGIFPLISSGILFVAALVAGYVPAWKASKTDPIQCLRYG